MEKTTNPYICALGLFLTACCVLGKYSQIWQRQWLDLPFRAWVMDCKPRNVGKAGKLKKSADSASVLWFFHITMHSPFRFNFMHCSDEEKNWRTHALIFIICTTKSYIQSLTFTYFKTCSRAWNTLRGSANKLRPWSMCETNFSQFSLHVW